MGMRSRWCAGKLAEVGSGEEAELALLGAVDGGVGGGEVAGRAGFDFEEDEGGRGFGCGFVGGSTGLSSQATRSRSPRMPGLRRGPALGDDGEAEGTKMEERGLLAAKAGEEMRRESGGGSEALEGFEGALLQGEPAGGWSQGKRRHSDPPGGEGESGEEDRGFVGFADALPNEKARSVLCRRAGRLCCAGTLRMKS